MTVALMQINEMITPPSVYNHNIPPNLEKIVLKATEKNPESRFHSFGEILEALDNVTVVRVMETLPCTGETMRLIMRGIQKVLTMDTEKTSIQKWNIILREPI